MLLRPQRPVDEGGFTLVELLLVILIIGVLAAIAIPSFLQQKSKADDAGAKAQVHTAETAAEAYSTEHNGSYLAMSLGALQALEPTLKETGSAKLSVGPATATSYEVTSESVNSKDSFTVKHLASGEVEHLCTTAGKGGCPAAGTW
jgi:type IV pilus assembly protein PilA